MTCERRSTNSQPRPRLRSNTARKSLRESREHGIRPTVDFVFKPLFGSLDNTDLLIHLLDAVLTPKHPIEEVELLNPFNDKTFVPRKPKTASRR